MLTYRMVPGSQELGNCLSTFASSGAESLRKPEQQTMIWIGFADILGVRQCSSDQKPVKSIEK